MKRYEVMYASSEAGKYQVDEVVAESWTWVEPHIIFWGGKGEKVAAYAGHPVVSIRLLPEVPA